ncbi:MAG: lysophospholipase [Saprospiraceae bacterium]|nr:lysophospholipase [Saprospiraceae bacterium]
MKSKVQDLCHMEKPSHHFAKKRKRMLVWILLLFAIGGLGLMHFYAPLLIIQIKTDTLPTKISLEDTQLKKINYTSKDGLKLCALISYTKDTLPKGTLIFLHGIRSGKAINQPLATRLNQEGYHAVLPDLRAHGESEGQYCTFGYYEKEDLKALITYLEKEEQTLENIGVWGHSLGAAIALQTMAEEPRIRYGVIESTFSDLYTVVQDYTKGYTGFSSKLLSNYLTYRAGKIANFLPDSIRPVDACQSIEQPIFMAHSDQDDKISITYGKANYAALKTKDKQFRVVEGANHETLQLTGGEAYFEEVLDFLSKNARTSNQ